MKKGATIQAIIDDQDFLRRLADANRIKKNPRIQDKESLYRSLYGYLPYDMPMQAERMMTV
jgi:hypothetical protein